MARRASRVLGVVGSGTQAYLQTLAIADELPIRDVRLWGRRETQVQSSPRRYTPDALTCVSLPWTAHSRHARGQTSW